MKTKNLTITALFSIIIAACSWITFSVGTTPLTLQTFAVALSGFLLGKKRGTAAVLLYLTMGAVGLPVFSALQGGFSVLLSPNGGFLWGFIPFVFLSSFGKSRAACFGFSLLGLAVCHIFGITQMCLISSISPLAAFLTASLPFLIKDILCVMVANAVAVRMKKELKL